MSFLTDTIGGPNTMEGTFTVQRRARGTNDGSGRVVAGALTTFTIDAGIQSLPGRQAEKLREVTNVADIRQVFTTARVDVATDAYEADRIVIGSKTFEVIRASHHLDDGEAFTNAVIAEVLP